MTMSLLHNLCPEIAERETRSLQILKDDGQLPRDIYHFVELYCDEKGCDCRTTFINVFAQNRKAHIATIRYGWESVEFYQRWMHDDGEMGVELQGVKLDYLQPQSKYAEAALALFQDVVMTDEYAQRIQRHYRQFREVVDGGALSAPQHEPSRNAPCPCGSGRKYSNRSRV